MPQGNEEATRAAGATSGGGTGTTATTGQPSGTSGISAPATGGKSTTIAPPPPPKLNRFHASAQLDPLRLGHDASRIAEDVVQHLTTWQRRSVRSQAPVKSTSRLRAAQADRRPVRSF